MTCVLGPNDWCSSRSRCFACEELTHSYAHPDLVDGCETCRLRSVQLSPAATPSKTRRPMKPGSKRGNNWEKGIVRDSRGMPMLDGGAPIGVKQWSENRHRYESAQRQLANA